MDEITIGDKTYVSSKQAAKITGYAKDYVGQLCREGRVEARLVGRNWYVLDSAIREHRFGKEDEVELVVKQEHAVTDRASTWQKPQYVAETPVLVPEFSNKATETVGSPAIADMQSAWREWFDEKKPPQVALPDGSDDFKDEYLPIIVPETAPEPVLEAPAIAQTQNADQEEIVAISRIRNPEPEPLTVAEQAIPEEERVELHRSYATANTPREEYEEVYPEQPFVRQAQRPITKPAAVEVKTSGSSIVVRALLVVVSVAAILTALIGTGNAEQLLSGTSLDYGVQKSIVDFLGGKSTYKSSL
ncbi:MAG: hypothetical protein QG636_121 [Patescibacteria group bacterium]|nr:hypothetical protein [Patescibacteria group bacterium]